MTPHHQFVVWVAATGLILIFAVQLAVAAWCIIAAERKYARLHRAVSGRRLRPQGRS